MKHYEDFELAVKSTKQTLETAIKDYEESAENNKGTFWGDKECLIRISTLRSAVNLLEKDLKTLEEGFKI